MKPMTATPKKRPLRVEIAPPARLPISGLDEKGYQEFLKKHNIKRPE